MSVARSTLVHLGIDGNWVVSANQLELHAELYSRQPIPILLELLLCILIERKSDQRWYCMTKLCTQSVLHIIQITGQKVEFPTVGY